MRLNPEELFGNGGTGSIHTTLMELGPKRPPLYGFGDLIP